MIDTNVHLFQWPFRRLPGDDPADLVARLRTQGVTQAWAGSYEALVHRDVEGVNARLAAACRRYGSGFLIPFGTVNPKQPDWQEDLRRCQEVHKMPGLRLYPNYHGYTLADPVVGELFSRVAGRKMLLQIALCMEDPRTQFPLMPVPKVVLLNDERAAVHVREFAPAGNVHFDIAMVEGTGGVGRLVTSLPPGRVVFGSHYPFFYFESALLKVREAGLAPQQVQAVLEDNARALLKP
jgi:hypothetical protein